MTKTKIKTETGGRHFFRRVRKHRLKYITILPSLVTLINGACGFAAIALASKGFLSTSAAFFSGKSHTTLFAMAGYMILLAMIADMLDGRLARMSQNTSSFGGQLDSLCDMISFGVAPAFLMLRVLECKLGQIVEPHTVMEILFSRFIWLAAVVYFSCVAIRLARFNVENEEDEASHMSFWGLPSPAAAGVIVSIVIFYQDMLPKIAEKTTGFYTVAEDIMIYSLPFITLGISLLMVSRVRYSHILNQYLKGSKPFAHLIKLVGLIVVAILNFEAALVLAFCGFALGGVLRGLYNKVIARKDISESPPFDRVAAAGGATQNE